MTSDSELLERFVRTNDQDAFAQIVTRHGSVIYAMALRLLGFAEEAADVTQAVFLLLSQEARRIRRPAALLAWLFQSTRYCCQHVRHQKAQRTRIEQEAAMARRQAVADSASTEELRAVLDDALARLAENQRLAVMVRHLEGRSAAETALILGISPDAAEKRVQRGLAKLRNILAQRKLYVPAAALLTLLVAESAKAAPGPILSAAATGGAAASATAIAQGGIAMLKLASLKTAALAACCLVPLLALSAVLALIHSARAEPPPSVAANMTGTAQSSAASAAASAPAPAGVPAFRGWVRISSGDPSNTSFSLRNTVTGALVRHDESRAAGQDPHITYQNPATGEYIDYHPSTDLVRLGTLSPDTKERLVEYAASLPLNLAAATAPLRRILGRKPEGIVHRVEEGLDYYDFSAALEEVKKVLQAQGNDPREAAFGAKLNPTAIWIDRATGLTQRVIIDGVTSTYTYGGPDISSIYDAGAPRTAKVYDNRPTAATIAVLDRMTKRAATRMPDGVSVRLDEWEQGASIWVHEQLKNHWQKRDYTVRSADPNPFMIDLPKDWTGAGADEFFRRLASAHTRDIEQGDSSTVDFQDFSSWTPEQIETRDKDGNVIGTIITRSHETGRAAKSWTRISSPARFLFSVPLSGQYDTVNHVELISDPKRPGLVGIRGELRNESPGDSIRAYDECWIDPAHGDRFVQYTEESYEDPPPPDTPPGAFISSTGRYKTITDYSDYATLPDGREYATRTTKTDYHPQPDGQFVPISTSTTTFHFFPSRTLPSLNTPTTLPALPPPPAAP